MNGTFVRNLETGKVELHFSKADYLALSDEQKRTIKGAFLFSGHQGCWVSRATRNDWRAIQVSKALGLADGGETGQRLTFTEQQAAKVEKAEARVERMERHAEKASERAAAAFDRADLSEGKSGIPFGQPILVGHHSERRHRRAIERADNAMRKGIEESDKAKYFEHRAENAAYIASQADLQDKRYLQNRIDENEAQLRDIDRKLSSTDSHGCTPEALAEWKTKLSSIRTEYQEKLDYFTAAMAALGGVAYSRENVKPGDMVKIRGTWEVVVKSNPKTVASTSGIMPWPLKHVWAEVQEHRPKPVAAKQLAESVASNGPRSSSPQSSNTAMTRQSESGNTGKDMQTE